MKKYEAVFILNIRKVDDEGVAFTKEFTGMLEEWGGNMVEAQTMGRKQFAREINKAKAGIYWNYVFNLDPDKVLAIRNQFRLDDRVIRLMIINYDRPEPKQAD
ncbi:MAG: 30S ribosomal protein S6 [Victivallaceae bacterium]|nr:30S ribosomal protein S6 [Victivallaceae bacterium]